MRVSKLAQTAAVVAVAATAGLAAGTANATTPKPAPVKAAKTTLKIAEAKDIVTGKLTEGKVALAKEKVQLWAKVAGKATELQVAVTNKNGMVTFTVKPKVTTQYALLFTGAKGLAASHSAEVTVKAGK